MEEGDGVMSSWGPQAGQGSPEEQNHYGVCACVCEYVCVCVCVCVCVEAEREIQFKQSVHVFVGPGKSIC